MATATLDPADFANWPFGEKVRYWKSNGAPGVTYQGGQHQFHDSTIQQSIDTQHRMAALDGRTLVPADEHGNPR